MARAPDVVTRARVVDGLVRASRPANLSRTSLNSPTDISELVEDVHYMLLSSGMTESEMVNLVDLSSRNHHARDEHSENLHYGSVL